MLARDVNVFRQMKLPLVGTTGTRILPRDDCIAIILISPRLFNIWVKYRDHFRGPVDFSWTVVRKLHRAVILNDYDLVTILSLQKG